MNLQTENQVVDLLIKNVNLMTMDESVSASYGLIEHGCIALRHGNIVWLGPESTAPEFEAAEIIDGNGHYLSPGLIDCHTHLVFAGSRAKEFEQRLTGVSYQQIAEQGGGILSTVRATRAAHEEQLLVSATKRVRQLISEGVTTVEIKSGYGLDTDNEIKMLRVASQLKAQLPVSVSRTFLGAHALPPEFAGRADDYINYLITDSLPKVVELDLADSVDGFCEGIGFSREQMSRLFAAADELGLPVKLHAEQLSDLSGAELVAEFDGLSADHLEYLSEQSIKQMAHKNTVAVLLPGAFYTLSETKLPPIFALREHNVPIAIGSDYNPGSSPLCSLKLMLHMACTQFKLTPEEATKGVTLNAAKALGLTDRGVLKVGKKADLCLWEIEHPAELAYTFGVNPLVKSWQNGQLVINN
ncbi:imidazolonepropionase [Psychrosphaera sp. B3R10]|uniref:imidazolonepropionase n=1 Tax=unclassified Psychrosphaera TaxID=2641570 RepID=UPI001C096D56|nr:MULTISPECIES: imidazolonepropionase [unclassified Psychrosphaera]MBU2881115.1 imidazolonepropionase [Psychrosphaera sp. I2R16]MBU2990039.1 imidazolonepropionase [Psychrosphaera sp. B3R10]MDO6721178.1 imidazolonepropionase [Psychrosphaera sp. 1_MG-2023]